MLGKKTKLSVKDVLIKSLNECECNKEKEKPFYLAPDVIGSINNATLHKDKNIFVINFNTTDGRKAIFNSPAETFFNWAEEKDLKNEENIAKSFLINFLQNAKELSNEENKQPLEEIVDELGNLIGNNDLPNNSSFNMVGNTTYIDTDKAVKQTMPKSKRYYGAWGGAGMAVWE